MEIKKIQEAASKFVELRLALSPSAPVADGLRPGDIDQGYRLQKAAAELLDPHKGAVCGYKIGCTTPVMQKFLGINHPCSGRLYNNEVFASAVTLKTADFVAVGVECEIALRLGKDLRSQDRPHSPESLIAAVSEVMAAAEIVDNRYQNFHEFGIPSLIADDFFSAGAVLGRPVALADVDLATLRGTTRIDDVEVGSGLGSDVMGHPLTALAWLANKQCGRGEMLKAGDVIMTGSVVETQWIDRPCVVTCDIPPLGRVQLEFH